MGFKIPDKFLDRATALLLVFGLVLSIGAVASPIFSMPYRYESGFKVYSVDIDLNGKNITQFSTPVSNVSKNYTVDPYDYFILVDTQAAGTAINLSIEHPGNKTGKELKIMRITDNYAVNVESARDFLGNSSNTSAGWTVGNVFYYNFTPGSSYNLSTISIKMYGTTAITTGVRLAIYNNTNATIPQPYQLLDQSDNASVYSTGWVNASMLNGTQVTAGTMYWIALKTTNSSTAFYFAPNQSTERGADIMTYNQGIGYGTFQSKVNVSAFASNQTVNKFVPNLAMNLAFIDGSYGIFNLTNLKYQHTLIQSDGSKWW